MLKKVTLIIPEERYAKQYIDMVNMQKETSAGIAEPYGTLLLSEGFAAYSERLRKDREGVDLREGWVPATLLWAIADESVIGRLHLRHTLPTQGGHIGYAIHPLEQGKGYGTEVLRLGLLEADKLGIKEVCLQCDKTNIASKTVIERNNGVLQKEYTADGIERLEYCIFL